MISIWHDWRADQIIRLICVFFTILNFWGRKNWYIVGLLKGQEQERKYIATQGPNMNTICEFWRMVWQYNCQCIVMVTSLFEHARVSTFIILSIFFWITPALVDFGRYFHTRAKLSNNFFISWNLLFFGQNFFDSVDDPSHFLY